MRDPTFWVLNLGFFLLGVTATSLVTQLTLPKYRYGAGHAAEPAAGTPLAQQV